MLNKIDNSLKEYLSNGQRKYKEVIFEAMEYSLLSSGKRIRPLLCIEFAKLLGASEEEAMPFACAVEMIHCYSLIHDDLPCMDNDELRRGKATNHVVYGENFALLAGDALLNLAFETMLSANVSAQKIVDASKTMAYYSGVNGMIGGQCIDLQSEGRKISIEELEAMDMGKTVAIISAACEMGVIIGNGSKKELDCAKRYAKCVGMAFQIRDDILDVIGNAEELGKNTGADELCEKFNYVTHFGLEEAQKLVQKFTEEAINSLKSFDSNTDFLESFALKMQNRTK